MPGHETTWVAKPGTEHRWLSRIFEPRLPAFSGPKVVNQVSTITPSCRHTPATVQEALAAGCADGKNDPPLSQEQADWVAAILWACGYLSHEGAHSPEDHQ